MSAGFQNRLSPAIHILLVEDNPGDARLTIHSLGAMTIPVTISATRDGEEALAFMRRQGQYSSAQPPDLVLLDLNMPRKNGFDVLTAMRNDPTLNVIPVVVLTSSDSEADILRSYDLHANAYIVKPDGLHQYAPMIRAIEEFWLRRAKLPTRSRVQ